MFKTVVDELWSFVLEILISLPGSSGARLRSAYYQRKFAFFGDKGSLAPGTLVSGPSNISIGENFQCDRDCVLNAEGKGRLVIGSRVTVNTRVNINASISGEITIGDDVLIGPGVLMRSSDHIFVDTNMLIRNQGHSSGKIYIGNDVWIGGNAIILKGSVIHDGAVIAAGAVVKGEVPAYAIFAGVPAKFHGWRGGEKVVSPQ